MQFKKLKIVKSGMTANTWTDENDVTAPIVISEGAVKSIVELGNLKKIHCRKTHNGDDMLDGYLGYFDNFVYEDGTAYADLTLSAALQKAYPGEASFIGVMITDEPDMLGVSIVGGNEFTYDEENSTFVIESFESFYSADLVGLPAATDSLFSNTKNKNVMNRFFSAFADVFSKKASSFATETIKVSGGGEITIEHEGDELKIGDKVFDGEGNTHEDGEVKIEVDGSEAILVVEGGVVKEVKSSEVEIEEDEEADQEIETTERVPEEFATRIDALEKVVMGLSNTISELNTQLKATSGKVIIPNSRFKTEKDLNKGLKLDRAAVMAAAAKYL